MLSVFFLQTRENGYEIRKMYAMSPPLRIQKEKGNESIVVLLISVLGVEVVVKPTKQ